MGSDLAAGYLIVITSAWSGQATNVFPAGDMATCFAMLERTRTSGDTAAFCTSEAPGWWLDREKRRRETEPPDAHK